MRQNTDARKNSLANLGINLGIATASVLLALVVAEFALRSFKPQVQMYPRYVSSVRQGHAVPVNTTMVHKLPGSWHFEYTVNEYGFRGPAVSVSNKYKVPNIVVMGDSYSFGVGVNDGSEYSAILGKLLKKPHTVVNLGIPGYGLTNQIRLYYEFGQLYNPEIIIIQFCKNDPSDNLLHPITFIEENRFTFRQMNEGLPWVRDLLSNSVIQHSHLYTLVKKVALNFYRLGSIDRDDVTNEPEVRSRSVSLYNELLEAFIADLHSKNKRVIFISVNNELDLFPEIKTSVQALHDRNLLEYLPVEPWFEGMENFGSPEGHVWGEKGHQVIGEQLAEHIMGFERAASAN